MADVSITRTKSRTVTISPEGNSFLITKRTREVSWAYSKNGVRIREGKVRWQTDTIMLSQEELGKILAKIAKSRISEEYPTKSPALLTK